MLDVHLCCAAADREAAEGIAARLEACAEARVWFEECGPEQSLVEALEGSFGSGATLLLLSPDSVPARLDRAHWEPVLNPGTGRASPPVGAVLVRDCAYPRLLERNHFFRWMDGERAALRAIERWVVGLHAGEEAPAFTPAPLPWFEGREAELERLWETLVDSSGGLAWIEGPPGAGKTSLAQRFARLAGAHFRDVLWVGCGDRSGAGVAEDLAAQLGGAPLAEHRLLLVLDDVTGHLPPLPAPGGRASVLVTARSGGAGRPAYAHVVALDAPGAAPALEPPPDREELGLWRAMSLCGPQGFPLELAARLAGIGDAEAARARDALIERRLVDPWDSNRLRLSARSREAARLGAEIQPLHRRLAELLHAAFSRWADAPARAAAYLPELERALEWACAADWELAARLAWRGFAFLRSQNRFAEGAAILGRLRDEAERQGDRGAADACAYELSWVLDPSGAPRARPDTAEQLTLSY